MKTEFLDRARSVDLGGTIVPMLDPEDLVIAKVLAGRPKDLEDAQNLWRLHGRALKADRIRHVLRELEAALGESDLVTSFESIVARAAGLR